jgi:hypothetical protein
MKHKKDSDYKDNVNSQIRAEGARDTQANGQQPQEQWKTYSGVKTTH